MPRRWRPGPGSSSPRNSGQLPIRAARRSWVSVMEPPAIGWGSHGAPHPHAASTRSACAAASFRRGSLTSVRATAHRRARWHSIRSQGTSDGRPGVTPRSETRRQAAMATREEIADILAGFTLFGDLQTPQLLGVAGTSTRCVPVGRADPPPGADRIGLLRDPRRHRGRPIDGQQRATLDAATSSARSRSCSVSRRPPTSSPPRRSGASRSPAPPSRASSSCTPGHVPDAPGPGASPPQRQPLAELSRGRTRHRASVPAGEYPAIVIGSGPGGAPGVVRAQPLRRPARRPVRRPAAGGMFRKWPFFQRLLSWTKPYAPEERPRASTSATTGTA